MTRHSRMLRRLWWLPLLAVLLLGFAATACQRQAQKTGFAGEIEKLQKKLKWDDRASALAGAPERPDEVAAKMNLKINRDILAKSFELGVEFLIKYQYPAGNFRYQYDWLTRQWKEDDNQVRQTGALWGLSLCHAYRPSEKSKAALEKGFDYWFNCTIDGPDNSLTVQYKEEDKTSSGTVALLALAIIEYLRVEKGLSADERAKFDRHLAGYLKFLQYMLLDSGHFAKYYYVGKGEKGTRHISPYFDGETLLALCKAAAYLKYDSVIPTIEYAAPRLAKAYTVDAWAKDEDSDDTKGFYQWGSMSFTEYYFAKWKDYDTLGDTVLALGHWMVHTHKVDKRSRNTAYALEGLISAYRIATDRGNLPAMIDLLYTIDRVFFTLTSWQIGGPLAHECGFLVSHPTDDPWAIGGVMNSKKPSNHPDPNTTYHELRVDVTQHQMHAVTMALRYVYPEN